MNVLVPPTQGRADYLRVVDQLAQMFNISPDAFIRQYKVFDSMLKLPQLLQPSTTTYKFNPVKAVDTPVPGEIKIDKNDVFAVTGVGLRFTKATYSSSTGVFSGYGNYKEYTYPYQAAFGSAATDMQTIVRGTISLSVTDDLQWVLPCSELVREELQVVGEPTTISYGPGEAGRGIKALNSIIILDGGADNLLTLSLLTGITTDIDGHSSDPDTRCFVMPVLQGLWIKNIAGGGGGFSNANCRI